MRSQFENNDDHEVDEILRRAIRREANDGKALRERLLHAASELGISTESVLAAEKEYRAESGRNKMLATYSREQKRGLRVHLVAYASVNLFLIAINLLTIKDDHTPWALFPLLGWGIGLVIHAVVAMAKPDWDSAEFQMWRSMRFPDTKGVSDSASRKE